MKRLLSIFVVLAMLFVMVPVGVASNFGADQPAQAADVVTCTSLRVGTDAVEIKCTALGAVVLDTTVSLPPGPTVTVSLPPIRVTATVRVPGPVQTATIKVPVPGPTQTVNVTATVSGPTATVTKTSVSTNTTTVSTGQVVNPSATLGSEPSSDPVTSVPPSIVHVTKTQAATIGTLFLIVLCGLILLGLYAGYILGYRDSEANGVGFLKSLLGRNQKE